MARDATLQFRIDAKVKEEAFAVFREMGISPSEAVRVFFRQVQKTRTLPFAVTAQDDQQDVVEDDYAQWLRQRLGNAIRQLDQGDMPSYGGEEAKALLRDRLASRRRILAAAQSSIKS